MTDYLINQVLPHSAPMILIDSIDYYNEDECSCSVTITDTSLFYSHNHLGVPSYVGTEYMAQTIAAFAGAHTLDNNEHVSIGFLLGSRKYETFSSYFLLNSKVQINIKQLYAEDSGLYVFDCMIVDENKNTLAKASINVFRPNNAEEFLKDMYE